MFQKQFAEYQKGRVVGLLFWPSDRMSRWNKDKFHIVSWDPNFLISMFVFLLMMNTITRYSKLLEVKWREKILNYYRRRKCSWQKSATKRVQYNMIHAYRMKYWFVTTHTLTFMCSVCVRVHNSFCIARIIIFN